MGARRTKNYVNKAVNFAVVISNWSHYRILMRVENPKARQYSMNQLTKIGMLNNGKGIESGNRKESFSVVLQLHTKASETFHHFIYFFD